MAALQPLPPGAPARIDEKPSMAAAEPQHRFPRDMPPDTDIGEYINDVSFSSFVVCEILFYYRIF